MSHPDHLRKVFSAHLTSISALGKESPGPVLMQYLDHYTPEQMRRHEVRPAGRAQVNGCNAITWEEKFNLDVWYVDHQSFWLDLKIIALRIWKLIKRKGINQPGQATAEEFMGKVSK